MSQSSLDPADLHAILDSLAPANAAVSRQFVGDGPARQPVHTVYGGAQIYAADSAPKLGAVARRMLAEYAPDAATLATVLGYDAALTVRLYPRVVEKLTREPVEDQRIDFEDGFGQRSPAEEDHFAEATAKEVARAWASGTIAPGIGIRIKSLTADLAPRSLRTLDLFVTTLLEATSGRLPPNFVVTLPKLTSPAQVEALDRACAALERARRLEPGALRIELMIETTQSVFAPDGTIALPALVAAGGGRVTAAHFGTYDYTAACGITGAYQHMLHPVCDFAKHVMHVALAGTGVRWSDGATNVIPAPPHRPSGRDLTPAERAENTRVVHRAWRLHATHIRHSLEGGFYQGWDLHPAQLPTRYAAVYAFFLESLDAASDRLKNFVAKAAQATLAGDVFDDAATGQGLLNYFLRALNCGAISEDEAVQASGLTLEELRSRSFAAILAGRSRNVAP